jgi:hypothetical protein
VVTPEGVIFRLRPFMLTRSRVMTPAAARETMDRPLRRRDPEHRRTHRSTHERRSPMSDTSLDALGPVDYIVVEFPAGRSNFSGEMTAELARLVDNDLIKVLDLLVLHKDADGSVEAFEIDDLDEVNELTAIEAQLAELLAEEDVEHLAAAMEPGTTAGVLIWENTWAAPFASAARRSGGQLIANGRIPIQAILASLEADAEDEEEGA